MSCDTHKSNKARSVHINTCLLKPLGYEIVDKSQTILYINLFLQVYNSFNIKIQILAQAEGSNHNVGVFYEQDSTLCRRCTIFLSVDTLLFYLLLSDTF